MRRQMYLRNSTACCVQSSYQTPRHDIPWDYNHDVLCRFTLASLPSKINPLCTLISCTLKSDVLSFPLSVRLPNSLLPSDFATKILYACLISPLLITLIINFKWYKSRGSSLWECICFTIVMLLLSAQAWSSQSALVLKYAELKCSFTLHSVCVHPCFVISWAC
jgi:hypothetical protein